MANNVSFADPDATVHKDIMIYFANGTLFSTTNTTSNNVALPSDADGDFLMVIKPQYSNPLEEPTTWMNSTFSWVETNFVALLACMFLIGLIFTRK